MTKGKIRHVLNITVYQRNYCYKNSQFTYDTNKNSSQVKKLSCYDIILQCVYVRTKYVRRKSFAIPL